MPVDQPWTDTGVSCAAGDTINIRASGNAWFDSENSFSSPEGLVSGTSSESRVASGQYTAAMLGALDTVDEPFYVGYATTYVCPVGGRLSLGVNDDSLNGNEGEYTAAVTHRPKE